MNKIIYRNDKYLKYCLPLGRGKGIGLGKIHNPIVFEWFYFIKQNGGKRKRTGKKYPNFFQFTQVEKIERTSAMRNTWHKHKETEMNTLNILVGE